MDGFAWISVSIPAALAKRTTFSGPTSSINLADIVFTEPAKPSFKVNIPPYSWFEFSGVQASGMPYLPTGIV